MSYQPIVINGVTVQQTEVNEYEGSLPEFGIDFVIEVDNGQYYMDLFEDSESDPDEAFITTLEAMTLEDAVDQLLEYANLPDSEK